MKRGLVKFDSSETPADCFEERLQAVRDELKKNDCTVGLIYGDVSRSGDLNYLTNFCLYWNEAVLAVPVEGKPALIMKLSKRVQPWIERTTVLGQIFSGPRPAENIGKYLEQVSGTRETRLGIIDMSWWPGPLIKQLQEALPGSELHDLQGLVRKQHLIPRREELELIRQAAGALNASLKQAWSAATTADDRVSIAVRESRKAGFLDADITSATLPDGSEYIAATGQYRYVWARLCQSRGGEMAEAAADMLEQVISEINGGVSELDLAERVRGKGSDKYRFVFSCMSHTDIETGGAFRPLREEARPFSPGEVIVPSLTFHNGNSLCMAAETVLVKEDNAKILTRA